MEHIREEQIGSNLPLLPTTVPIYGRSGDPTLHVTILGHISPLHVEHLNPHSISNRKLVFLLNETVQSVAHASNLKVKQCDERGQFQEYGYLTRCGNIPNAYTLMDLDKESWNATEIQHTVQKTQVESEILNVDLPAGDIVRSFECEPAIDPSRRERLQAFSMKPPVPELPAPTSKIASYLTSPQSELDPLSFLLSRYYSTLYSLTTPLSYFPKTALARFKIMCGNDASRMKTNLLSVYLTTEQLEERYNNKFGLESALSINTSSLSSSAKYEAENRRLFAEKHLFGSLNEEVMRKFVLELKIREAQLQILVLMELMLVWPIDEEQFLHDGPLAHAKTAAKAKKTSLVRRRGTKKKIIPTFLGVGVEEFARSPEKPTNKVVNEVTLYTSLITLVDQMGIWDTLLGRIKGEKDESMYGFLAYVLVPFFNKQLPHIVSFVIQKVKELRPKLKVPKSRSRKSKLLLAMDVEGKPEDNANSKSENGEDKPRKLSKFAKVLLSPDQKPFLKRAATVGAELSPAFLLKRSKSNLGSKNLKRRQVDISVTSSTTEAEETKRLKSFLFGDARRVRSVTSTSATLQTQVEATPRKQHQRSSTSMTNSNSAPIVTSQVMATPSHTRVVDYQQQILETPRGQQDRDGFAVPGGRGPSLQEKFAKLAPPMDLSWKITSSPVRESTESTPNLFLHSSHGHQSSPQFAVTSSPVTAMTPQKHKPGEPVPMVVSPFYTSNLNGLPPNKSIFGGTRRTAKLVRKEKALAPPIVERSKTFSNNREFATPSLKFGLMGPDLNIPQKLEETVFKNPNQLHEMHSSVNSSKNEGLSECTDTDSDSDLEKLLSTVARPAIRKYTRR